MRRLALITALAALSFALAHVPPHRGAGPPLRDFEAYYAAGQTWHYNGDPYGRDVWRTEKDIPGVGAARYELLPFVGPPFGLPLWSALARLPWPTASFVWAAVLGVAFATIVFGSLALGNGRVRWFDAFAALAFAAAFAPLTGGVSLGQVALVSCAAIVALPWALRPRGTLGAAALALGAALQPNLAIVLVARLAESRAWIAFGSAALVALGASALALGGPAGIARYVGVVRAQGEAERFIAIQTTPNAVARALGASPALASTLAVVCALAVVAALIVTAVRWRHDATMRLVLACALVPLALPFSHEHDFTIAFLPALVLLTRARGAAWVWAACAVVTLSVDWIGLAQRPTGLVSTVSLAIAAACASVALARGSMRPYHAAPLAIAVGVFALGTLAVGHLLPTWPDALPANFHETLAATAPQVWRAEQNAAGIAALDPFWGVLRAIPLIACVILWSVGFHSLTDREHELRNSNRVWSRGSGSVGPV